MRRWRALDVCCCAGGASEGLHRAGFRVTGIDIEPQKNYPFVVLRRDLKRIDPDWVAANFDFIWLSPPCQFATALNNDKSKHENLIPAARWLARECGLPYVIENVVGAEEHLRNPIMLSGTMFRLGAHVDGEWYQLARERLFESNFPIPIPEDTYTPDQPIVGVYGGHARNRSKKFGGRGTRDFVGHSQKRIAADAMGIDWMTLGEMSEAIPPAFAEHIGKAAIQWLTDQKKAA